MLFHKKIIFALLALGNCQQLLACTQAEREQLRQNVCSNVSLAISCLCLYARSSSFAFGFQSFQKCVEARETLNNELNIAPEAADCHHELQLYVNHTMLKEACKIDGVEFAFHQEEGDLCPIIPTTNECEPFCNCHRFECITRDNDLCKNLTMVEEFFEHLNQTEIAFNETQQYIMKFNNTRGGRHQCNKAAEIINLNSSSQRYESTLHTKDCGPPERILYCTLNLEGLKWACSRRHLMRVTFEEKYLNESICRNVTKAQSLFFSSNTNIETFTVTYDKRSTNACNSLADSLKNSTDANIYVSLSLIGCDNTPQQIQGAMNYEALKLVCSKTDPMIATVVQLRNDVQPAIKEPNTNAPGSGLIFG